MKPKKPPAAPSPSPGTPRSRQGRSPEGGTGCTRREVLGPLAVLFLTGWWPGVIRLAARDDFAAEEIVFVAANDFHHHEAACDPWFEALFRQIGAHRGVEFCLGIGDLAHRGLRTSIATIARLARLAAVPFYPVAGNHDCDVAGDTSFYAEELPGRLNYVFTHRGWQFVALDSTAGTAWQNTEVTPTTLTWLDGELARLDRRRPTVLFTHFPLLAPAKYCLRNAEEVLGRFVPFNLRLVLSGHYHARTHATRDAIELVTNACCSRVAPNHDGTREKGYWLCRGRVSGEIEREFVPFVGPAAT